MVQIAVFLFLEFYGVILCLVFLYFKHITIFFCTQNTHFFLTALFSKTLLFDAIYQGLHNVSPPLFISLIHLPPI